MSASCLRRWINTLAQVWHSMQVSHRGRYSIERLLALEEYTQHTPRYRVALVCLGTPLPMIAFVLSQECIPLQDPSEGWKANYGIWIRIAIVSGVVSYTILVQIEHMIVGISVSLLQTGLILSCVMVGYIAFCLLIAAFLVFPIPFITITMIPPFFTIVAVSFRFVVGKSTFMQIVANPDQLLGFLVFISAQTLMSIIYPAYQVLFNASANTRYELPVVLLLPIIKFITKNAVSLSILHREDMIPEGVIFTVDFFNAVYAATCMQRASSFTTVGVIMAVDLIHIALALRSLHRNALTTRRRLGRESGVMKPRFYLLEESCSLCHHADKFENQERSQIEVRSCLPHKLSPAGQHLLASLEKFSHKRPSISILYRNWTSRRNPYSVQDNSKTLLHIKLPRQEGRRESNRHSSAVHATATTSISSISVKSTRHGSIPTLEYSSDSKYAPTSPVLKNTLEMLFTSECLVLTEYLESFIPVVYANFVCIMVQLPSARYHAELNGLTPQNVGSTVNTVFIYALLECVSFVGLIVVVQRHCGMHALYQLAFVLETQMALIQSKLMTWMLLTLACRVVHYGFDFSFQFSWIQARNSQP